MPVIVTSDMYPQGEDNQPSTLETAFLGFAEGVAAGIQKSQEEVSETKRFEREKQAELAKIREQARLQLERDKALADAEKPYKDRAFDIEQKQLGLQRERFEDEKTRWQEGSDARGLQLSALRRELADNTEMSALERERKKQDLAAGEITMANENVARLTALREGYAEAIGDGNIAKGQASLDAMEGLVEQQIAAGNYKEANRILGMAQTYATKRKAVYEDNKAQAIVAAAKNNQTLLQHPGIVDELTRVSNDTSLTITQRGAYADLLVKKAATRSTNNSLKLNFYDQIDADIGNYTKRMDAASEEEDVQLQSAINELILLKTYVEGQDSDDQLAVMKAINEGRQVFFRKDSERGKGPLFSPGAAGSMPTGFKTSEESKAFTDQLDALGQAREAMGVELAQYEDALENMDEDDPSYASFQAAIADIKQAQLEAGAMSVALFRQTFGQPGVGNAKQGGVADPASGPNIENKLKGGGNEEEEATPEYGKGMKRDEIEARIKELNDLEQGDEGLSQEESDERDALSKLAESTDAGVEAQNEILSNAKMVNTSLRTAFAGETNKVKFSLNKVYSRREAEVVLGHFRQMEKDINGALTGRTTKNFQPAKNTAKLRGQLEAVQQAQAAISAMINTGNYPAKPKPEPKK